MPTFTMCRRLCVALLFLGCTLAQAVPPGVTQGPTVEGVTEYTLQNGFKVLLFPDATKPTMTVNVTYLVGSRQESYGETGMAHLLEHMLFKGTPTSGNLMQELGKRGMDFNGSTFFDRTNYHETFPASEDSLQWALAMEADRMVHSNVARKDLDTEMTVVRNEFERWENNPRLVLWGRMQAVAFDWHNYGNLSIGARSDIENVSIERLQAFYRTYYQPDNAVLVVAGAIDSERTLGLVARYFGPIPKPARTLPKLYTREPVQDGERSVTVRRVGGNKVLGMLHRTVPGAAADETAIEALGEIMTVAPAGRLYKSLVEGQKASSVETWTLALHDPGMMIFWAQIPELDTAEAARQTMAETIAAYGQQPTTQAELDRVRAKALKDFEDTINDPQRLGVALSETIALGDWRVFFLQRDRWKQLTPADIDRVAAAYLKPANRTVGEYLPEPKPDRAPAVADIDVPAMVKNYKGEEATAAGETFDPTPSNLEARTQRFTLPNGAKVALMPKRTRGATVQFQVSLHYGDLQSVSGRRPEGTFAAAMLMRGTTSKNRQEIEDTLDRLRAKLDVSGSQTGTTASGQAVRANLADTLRLAADVLQHPSFPAAELEQIRRARLTSLQQQRTDPQDVARRALARHNNPYRPNDPRYAPDVDEDIAEVLGMSLERAQGFYKAFFGASAAEIAIVGDFDPAEMRTLLTELFGQWKSPAPFTRVPDPFVPNMAAVMQLETPDRANAVMFAGEGLQISDTHADYPALLVVNYLLGESTNSRLLNRLRQQDGISYGAGSRLQPNPFEPNSGFLVFAIFAPENLPKVQTGVQEELARLLKEGFTAAEVDEGKRGLIQERRLARAQDPVLTSSLVNQLYLGRTFEMSARIDAAIGAATVDDINAVVRKYIQTGQLAFVFAGDFAKSRK